MRNKRKITKNDIKTIKKHFTFSVPRLFLCIILLSMIITAYFVLPKFLYDKDETQFIFHAVNVGDGDCFILELPDGKILMIDTGKPGQYSKVKDYLNTVVSSDKIIDYFINTHPDDDHYGGMEKLFNDFDVKVIYRPCFDSASILDDNLPDIYPPITESKYNAYGKVVDAMYIETADVRVIDMVNDDIITDLYKVIFHSPTAAQIENDLDKSASASIANGISPMITIEYGNNIFVFTGDATDQAEELFIQTQTAQEIFNADRLADKTVILKVAHHGSGTKYSDYAYGGDEIYDFIFNGSKTAIAVISCGDGYGFPNARVVADLEKRCNEIWVTKDLGNIKLIISAVGGVNLKAGDAEKNMSAVWFSTIFAAACGIIIVICFFNYKGGKNAKLRDSFGGGKKVSAKK